MPDDKLKQDKLKRLEALVKAASDAPTIAEFEDAFKQVMDYVEKAHAKTAAEVDKILTSLDSHFSSIRGTNNSIMEAHKASLKESQDTFFTKMEQMISSKLAQLKNGNDGYTPQKGVDYQDGADGSPDTPEEVRAKLEKVGISMNAVEGLQEALVAAKATKGKAGSGGTGAFGSVGHSPISESFSMDGVLTSVTLSQGVTAGGNAIIVRMQGQVLDPTTHYTVNGNKVSFTFTPTNGSTISTLYWP